VEERRDGELAPIAWTQAPEFSNSDRFDRHFTLDTATGEIAFGPSVRQADGSVRQYGRIPEARREIRFTRYRFGGGVAGNVPAGKIQMLKSAVPYIASVSNLRRSEGGRDQETLEEAKFRARREVRAQERAVTADDYAVLAQGASRAVARVICVTPAQVSTSPANTLPPGMLELLVVPAVFDAVRNGDLGKLALGPLLARQIETHLEPYRLLTTTVRVREPRYLGVKVSAEIVTTDYSDPEVVRANVRRSLREFISPLDVSDADHARDELLGPRWEGWPFGRSLFISELYALIQRAPGVKHVLEVRLSTRPVLPGDEAPQSGEQMALVAAGQNTPLLDASDAVLTTVKDRRLEIAADTLLCSLDHDIQVVTL
jgi:predicted phage baseplate assembly protein